jgi:hypothetical protein
LTSREYYPTGPSRPAAASQLLSWASAPYSTREIRRSTLRGLCLPATFRLQGLVTLLTAYSLRTRAGLVSYRRRSWDSPFGAFSSREGVRYVSARTHPLTVSPAAIPSAEARDRHGRPRFLGFDPSGNPWRPSVCLAHRALDAPLGFALLGSWEECLGRDFARPPLTCFPQRSDRRAAPQSIDQHSSSSHPALRRAAGVDETTL